MFEHKVPIRDYMISYYLAYWLGYNWCSAYIMLPEPDPQSMDNMNFEHEEQGMSTCLAALFHICKTHGARVLWRYDTEQHWLHLIIDATNESAECIAPDYPLEALIEVMANGLWWLMCKFDIERCRKVAALIEESSGKYPDWTAGP